jgi:hypothetical protein
MEMWISNRRAFIVVLAAIAAVSATVVFANSGAPGTTASERPDARTNLNHLGMALLIYAQDYDDALPPMNDALTVRKALGYYVSHYLKNESAFIEPQTKLPFTPNPSLSGQHLDTIYNRGYRQNRAIVAFYSATPKTNGSRYVLLLPKPAGYTKEDIPLWKHPNNHFANLEIKSVSKKDWLKFKRVSEIP